MLLSESVIPRPSHNKRCIDSGLENSVNVPCHKEKQMLPVNQSDAGVLKIRAQDSVSVHKQSRS